MDPFAALAGAEESENDASRDADKKEKKKKMASAPSKKLQAKLAEEMRQQLIRQKQEALRETKKRVLAEWEANHAKALVYEEEFGERLRQLNVSFERLSEVENAWNEYLKEKRISNEWAQYLKCGRLPDPSSVSQMNSYIFVWTEIEKFDQMPFCVRKTEEVMKLLTGLEEVIDSPAPDRPPKFLKELKELRLEIRNLLQENIDRATFSLFSRIESDMVPINVTTSKYFVGCPHFAMSLWAEITTPIPSTTGKEIRNPLRVAFEETDIAVVIPVLLLNVHKAVRAMWVKYDHWSDKCRTHDCPDLPFYFRLNSRDLLVAQYEIKVEIMSQREKLEATTKKKIANIPLEPTLSQEMLAWESEPQRALSEEIAYRENAEEDDLGRIVKSFLREFEVNLRERTFLGDLLLLEMFHSPPQPKCLRFKHNVTLRETPPKLRPVDYYVKYPPPEPESEEEEEEGEDGEEREVVRKRPPTPAQPVDPAEEYKKLVVVQLKPCQSVLWFEEPQLANWDPVHGYWSTENIHDMTHDEEEGVVTFRTGRLGLMGFHVSRHCNLPYRDWVFEAGRESGVDFHLKTSKAEFGFNIREGEVCLESMKGVPGKMMNWILGKYYPPSKLMELMKKGGIDVFPAPDAASYIEEIQSKHVVVESNVYQVWGIFSHSFRFKRSKFNQAATRGDIVFQAQEVYKDHQVDFCLLQTTVCASYVLDVTEESEAYSPDPAPYMKTYVDLYGLLCGNSTLKARRQSDATGFLLVQTVKEFLSLIRPLSFS